LLVVAVVVEHILVEVEVRVGLLIPLLLLRHLLRLQFLLAQVAVVEHNY
jgi:hypothetical protein